LPLKSADDRLLINTGGAIDVREDVVGFHFCCEGSSVSSINRTEL
jgi:hypothetical protein